MLSLVCVYNDTRILEEALLKSLKRQTVPYDLILLDNTGRRYKSAAQALNHGGALAKGEYIVFLHQDMFLGYDQWLEDAEIIINGISDLGIAGVAGVRERGKHWQDRVKYAFMHLTDQAWKDIPVVDKPEEVQTLDECLLIIPKNVFNKLKFDDVTFDGWDCYGADYCLAVRNFGLRSYVLPLPCIHSAVRAYIKIWEYAGLHKYKKKLYAKYKRNYKKIYTFMGTVSREYLAIYSLIIFFGPVISRCAYFSFENVWKRFLKECKTVLDLGCGIKSPVQFYKVDFSTGVDISKASIEECRRLNIYNEVLQEDVLKNDSFERKYDAVISLELLEYLERKEALRLLKKMESLCEKKVIVQAVNGVITGNSNPLSEYSVQKSSWHPGDFSSMGYSVRGLHGWKKLRNNQGLIKNRPTLVWEMISMMTQPLAYFLPGIAYKIIAVKSNKEK